MRIPKISLVLILLFLVVISVLPKAASQTTQPECNTRAILDHFKARGVTPPEKQKPPRSDREITDLFKEVKALALNEILQGRAKSELQGSQLVMYERIERLTMRLDSCGGEHGSGEPPGRNSLLTHVIILCQSARVMPTLALVQLLGHEIGHSNDLCNLGGSFYRRKNQTSPLENLVSIPSAPRSSPTNTEKSVKKNSRESSAEQPFSPDEFRRNLREVSSGDYMIDTSFHGTTEAMGFIQQLSRQGHLEKLDDGVPIERNPLAPTYRCLTQRDERRYKPLASTHDQVMNARYAYSEPGAQIWGARLLARYLEKHPSQESDALGVFANVTIHSNPAKGASEKESDLNHIYFSEPEIQKALNCKPSASQNCMSYFNPSGLNPSGKNPSGSNLPAQRSAPRTNSQ